jgi:hypothetical protein
MPSVAEVTPLAPAEDKEFSLAAATVLDDSEMENIFGRNAARRTARATVTATSASGGAAIGFKAGSAWAAATAGAKKGAKLGTIVKPGLGTLAGAIVGGAIAYAAFEIGYR